MTKEQLVAKLQEMREVGVADRRVSAMTHLFGIMFKREIYDVSNPSEIAREAGVPDYVTDGCNLASYVTVKKEHLKHWQPD